MGIQYLRALAALGVVGFHAAQRAGGAFGIGAAGVDVFFVISGFIMWTVSAGRRGAPLDFLRRRAVRIVPLYWAATLAVVALDLGWPSLFPNMVLTTGHVLKSLLFIPHLDPHGALAPVIVPGWTLNYEVFFYVVFAAALAAPIWARALALTAGLVGLCLMGSAAPAPGHAAWAVYSDPIVLEFVAGVWIARAGLPVGRGAAWTAIGAGLAGLLLVEGLRLNPIGVMRLAYWGAPAVLVVTGVVGLERAGAVRRLAALKLLGDASYSIYLVHGLALSLAFKVALAIGLGGAAAAVPSAVFACGVGLACHFTVERPLLRLFRRGARRPIAAAAQIAGSGA